MERDIVKMSMKELKRVGIIEKVIEGGMTQKTAGKLIGVVVRQIRRIVERFRQEGQKGLVHRSRGRQSNRKYPELLKQRVLKIYGKEYRDFGPTLAQEKLSKRNRIEIGCETLRQWLLEAGLWERERKVSGHRKWRERKACYGEMEQGDGSHHDWLEGRGPWLVLMKYIDDATSRVFARFYDYEGTMPAMDSFYRYLKKYGLPHSLYMDKHSTYQSTERLSLEDELEGRQKALSQFGRALAELGVELIAAHSPQAKGRVERSFRTFQDRLVKEMRLAGIKTKEEANEFLDKKFLREHNRRFARKARQEEDLHRPIPKAVNLKQVLSIQTKHVLRNDNTIRHENQFYQIEARWKGKRPKQVVVEQRVDGRFCITHRGGELVYRKIQEPVLQWEAKKKARKPQKVSIPAIEHPWKGASFRRMQAEKVKVAA